jgi:hypothetical protein
VIGGTHLNVLTREHLDERRVGEPQDHMVDPGRQDVALDLIGALLRGAGDGQLRRQLGA